MFKVAFSVVLIVLPVRKELFCVADYVCMHSNNSDGLFLPFLIRIQLILKIIEHITSIITIT